MRDLHTHPMTWNIPLGAWAWLQLWYNLYIAMLILVLITGSQAFHTTLLFCAQLVRYNEDGNLFVKMPTDDEVKNCMTDTAFNKHTTGGRTMWCALAACNLLPNKLDAILLHVHEFMPYSNNNVTDFNKDFQLP